jgi:hypothetical protein
MEAMSVAVKKLDVQIGDLIEIGGRRYDVVSNKAGGVALEPAITKTLNELRAEHGTRGLTEQEFDARFGQLPSDDEG